jgi:hypothetical protein
MLINNVIFDYLRRHCCLEHLGLSLSALESTHVD